MQSALDELVRLTPIAQLTAYTALTITSIVVACAQVGIAFRNSFGWKPLLYISGVSQAHESGVRTVNMNYEIWNRRRYPVVIRSAVVTVTWYDLHGLDSSRPTYTTETADPIAETPDATVAPSDRRQFSISPARSSAPGSDLILISLKSVLFDPVKGREHTLKADRAYTLSEIAGAPQRPGRLS